MAAPGSARCWNGRARTGISAQGFTPRPPAALFAQAGLTGYDFVQEWVTEALNAFRALARAESLCDIAAENKHGKLVFLGDRRIPTVFHLRVLAYTNAWRTAENKRMLAAAFEKLYRWLPLPQIYIKAGSQLVAPLGSIAMPLNRGPVTRLRAFFVVQA